MMIYVLMVFGCYQNPQCVGAFKSREAAEKYADEHNYKWGYIEEVRLINETEKGDII